jgi:hypothetical protein
MIGPLYDQMFSDLLRPHPFAYERVGFALGRLANAGPSADTLLLSDYVTIPDDEYLRDGTVGARIGCEAITRGTHAAYYGRPFKRGVFHVHMHAHFGPPSLSGTDWLEIPPIIRGFRSVGPGAPYGILLLSADSAAAWLWPIDARLPEEPTSSITVIDAPIRLFSSS